MSVFSSVDAAPDPSAVVAYLDQTARAAWRMKHYGMAAHALRQPDGLVLDLGCGVGHDLRLLASAGLAAAGVEFANERGERPVTRQGARLLAASFRDELVHRLAIRRFEPDVGL